MEKIKINKVSALTRYGIGFLPNIRIEDKQITTNITVYPEVSLYGVEQYLNEFPDLLITCISNKPLKEHG